MNVVMITAIQWLVMVLMLMMIYKYDLTVQFTVVRTAAAATAAAAVPMGITTPSSCTRATEAP